MKYLSWYTSKKKLGDVPDSDCRPAEEGFGRSGHTSRRKPSTCHTQLRAGAQRQSVGDRCPFAETKEQLAGFYLIDAKDLNEAIQLASKIPPAAW